MLLNQKSGASWAGQSLHKQPLPVSNRKDRSDAKQGLISEIHFAFWKGMI